MSETERQTLLHFDFLESIYVMLSFWMHSPSVLYINILLLSSKSVQFCFYRCRELLFGNFLLPSLFCWLCYLSSFIPYLSYGLFVIVKCSFCIPKTYSRYVKLNMHSQILFSFVTLNFFSNIKIEHL